MNTNYCEQIMELRKQKYSTGMINRITGASKATISKYCRMVDNNDEIKMEIAESKIRKFYVIDGQGESAIINKRVRRRTKEWLVRMAGNKCSICGYDKTLSALCFHHIDPSTKKFDISGVSLTWDLKRIVDEVKKCALLCSNCHFEVHDNLIDPSTIKPIEILDANIPNFKLRGITYVSLKCPNCEKIFEREKRETHLSKAGKYTCCSKHCASQFMHKNKNMKFADPMEFVLKQYIKGRTID